MLFGQKLKELRNQKGLTQKDLAKEIGLSSRSIAAYENDGKYPRHRETYYRLAEVLGCNPNDLMTDEGAFITDANERYGDRGAQQAWELTRGVAGAFAGGTLSPEDMDEMMKAIQDAYWLSKANNKKFAPKKKDV